MIATVIVKLIEFLQLLVIQNIFVPSSIKIIFIHM